VYREGYFWAASALYDAGMTLEMRVQLADYRRFALS
jgi:hypothetical protein